MFQRQWGSSLWLEQKAYVRIIRMESKSVQGLLTLVKDSCVLLLGRGGGPIGNPGAEKRHSKQCFEKTDLRLGCI